MIGSPHANYESLVTNGHTAIDRAFSTEQAYLYFPEAKANDLMNQFAIGMPPLPGTLGSIFSDTRKFKEAGKLFDRADFTRAGRGLMKHGYREGSNFPKPVGTPAQINKQGQTILEEIIDDPLHTVYQQSDGSLKIFSKNGRGAYFKKDCSFRGFLEKQYE